MSIGIKDIARISGVSISTVSKIMNNKAESIAEATRLKVLQVAKENHYTPYAKIKRKSSAHSYVLAIVALLEKQNIGFIKHLEAAANAAGYKVMLSDPGRTHFEAETNARAVCESADGLIVLESNPDFDLSLFLANNKVPAVFVDVEAGDAPAAMRVSADWQKAGRAAVEYLATFGHRRVGLLSPAGASRKSAELKSSLERYYSEREMVFDHKLAATPESISILFQAGATALICADMDMAARFYKFAWEQDLMIPHEVSVITINGEAGEGFLPPLATVGMDYKTLAANCLEALIAQLESRAPAPPAPESPVLIPAESVSWPENMPGTASHILVVGTLNLDVVMNVPAMPTAGDTLLIESLLSLPGGKGANQALGVAKLGGDVSIIGRIGCDSGGRVLYTALREAGVNTRGISVDRQLETGKAYINVDAKGDSFIEVYNGANQRLEKRHLERNEVLFRSSRYCLIQSELPRYIYTQAVEFAHRNGAAVIFKPAAVDSIDPEVMAKIHLFIPNQKEAARLAGQEKNIEEQAEFFLNQGAREVIITLAEQGCFYCGRETRRWYPAYEEPGLFPVDTSGASDAFISALAFALAEGQQMDSAILYAQVAAGLSICQKGVQSSMPDRGMMELRKSYYQPK